MEDRPRAQVGILPLPVTVRKAMWKIDHDRKSTNFSGIAIYGLCHRLESSRDGGMSRHKPMIIAVVFHDVIIAIRTMVIMPTTVYEYNEMYTGSLPNRIYHCYYTSQ